MCTCPKDENTCVLPAPFFSRRPAGTLFSWTGGLPCLQYLWSEAFLAVAATCARKASMPFYAPQSRQQQAQALLAAFLQTDGLPLDDVLGVAAQALLPAAVQFCDASTWPLSGR